MKFPVRRNKIKIVFGRMDFDKKTINQVLEEMKDLYPQNWNSLILEVGPEVELTTTKVETDEEFQKRIDKYNKYIEKKKQNKANKKLKTIQRLQKEIVTLNKEIVTLNKEMRRESNNSLDYETLIREKEKERLKNKEEKKLKKRKEREEKIQKENEELKKYVEVNKRLQSIE